MQIERLYDIGHGCSESPQFDCIEGEDDDRGLTQEGASR